MDPLAEADVLHDAAGHVEPVGVRKLALVAVRGTDHEHDARALGDRHAVEGHVAHDRARGQLQRRRPADGLLDGLWDERWVVEQQTALVGVLGEELEHRPDQAGRRFHAAEEEDHHQAHHLGGGLDVLLGERDPVDGCMDDGADDVVPRARPAVLEQVDEVVADAPVRLDGLGRELGPARHAALESVDPALELVALGLVLPGQAHQREEDVEGRGPGDLLGEVRRSPVAPPGQVAANHGPDGILVRTDAPRQERRLDDRPDLVVARVVDVAQGSAARHLLAERVVDVHALERPVQVRVEQGAADVLEAGEGVPAPARRAPDRRLVEQPAVRRERMLRVEVGVERVVLGDDRCRHGVLRRATWFGISAELDGLGVPAWVGETRAL